MILVVDNYDSFVFNLARYFERLGQTTRVIRNDRVGASLVRSWRPEAIVLSPGPCTPTEAGSSLALVREFYRELPMLGICLGHQSIVAALGGKIVRAAEPRHGRSSQIEHDGRGVFRGIPNPFTAARYHSLLAEESSLPGELEVSARTVDGSIMAVRHRELPVVGLQFHPESVLTDCGFELLAAFLRLAGISVREPVPTADTEWRPSVRAADVTPQRPVTF